MDSIRGFFGEYRYLSNFYPSPIIIDGVSYQTVEHFYQASKADSQEGHDYVNAAPGASAAKSRGREVTIRSDWNKTRLAIMTKGIEAKFSQNSDLADKLLSTHPMYLEETNSWGDKFWGVCNGVGENHLGRILTTQRTLIKMERLFNGD